jgi:hypothetical protein
MTKPTRTPSSVTEVSHKVMNCDIATKLIKIAKDGGPAAHAASNALVFTISSVGNVSQNRAMVDFSKVAKSLPVMMKGRLVRGAMGLADGKKPGQLAATVTAEQALLLASLPQVTRVAAAPKGYLGNYRRG